MSDQKPFDAYEVLFQYADREDFPIRPNFPHYVSAELPSVGDVVVLHLSDGPQAFEVVRREFRFDRGGVVWIHVKDTEFPRT